MPATEPKRPAAHERPATRAVDLPAHYNAVDILERNVRDRPHSTALLGDFGRLSFAEVSAGVDAVARGLLNADLNVSPGEVVAILSPDRPEWAMTFFASVKIGAVALGLNTLLTPREYDFMLDDSRASVLVVDESLLDKVPNAETRHEGLREVIVIGGTGDAGSRPFQEFIREEGEPVLPAETHRNDICSLHYTSGTTGAPKGVPHAHKDYPLTAELWGRNVLGLTSEDRTFSAAKLFFVYGLGGGLIFPWHVGAEAVLFAGSPRDAPEVLRQIERHRPTVLYHAPTGYAAMLAALGDGGGNGDDNNISNPAVRREKYDTSSLRLCSSAGEALPAPIWRRWRDATGVDIIDGIGSTENLHIFLSNRPGDVRPGSSGKPIDGYEVRIVDEESGGETIVDAPNVVGTLVVRGETAATSYLRREEESRRTFLDDGWMSTGDKYYVDEDGYYHHAGRGDDMLKVGGIWVSPMEVESTLLSHPGVLECAVVGSEDGAGLIKPLAYVVPKVPERVAPSDDGGFDRELIEYCRSRMAAYKRPRWVVFVDELPKTATGKIRRFRLRHLANDDSREENMSVGDANADGDLDPNDIRLRRGHRGEEKKEERGTLDEDQGDGVISFYGFRGCRTVNGTKVDDLPAAKKTEVKRIFSAEPLLWSGHVAMSADGGKTLFGFTLIEPDGKSNDEITKMLLKNVQLPGIVVDNTDLFERARAYAADEGWNTTVWENKVLVSAEYQRSVDRRLRELARIKDGSHGYKFTFPFKERDAKTGLYFPDSMKANCATLPDLAFGIRIPETTSSDGRMRNVLPVMEKRASFKRLPSWVNHEYVSSDEEE